jgi:hypothetical protein
MFTPWPGAQAVHRAASLLALGNSTITLSGANPTFKALGACGTVQLTESHGAPLGMGFLFHHRFEYRNDANPNLNFGPVYTLVDQPTFNPDCSTGAREMSLAISFLSWPALARAAGSNTFTLSSLSHMQCQVAIGAGTALGTRRGLDYAAALTPGTDIAVDIAALTATTLACSMRSAGAGVSMRHAGGVRLGDSTAGPDTLLHLTGTASKHAAITFDEEASNPAAPTASAQLRQYMKGDKLVIQFNHAGTTRYFTLDLTQSSPLATWAQSTTAP